MLLAWFSVAQFLELALIGVAAGLLGGLLGIGGGLVMIPGMLLILGEPYGPGSLHLYKLASLLTSVVLSIPATRAHIRAGAMAPALLRPLLPAAVGGAVLGLLLASFFAGEQTRVIRRVFGAFMILTAGWDLYIGRRARAAETRTATCPTPRRRFVVGGVAGLPAGLIAGFLGVGGGVWAVPAQHLVLGIRLPNAIANSAAMIVVVAAVSAVGMCLVVQSMPDLSLSDGLLLSAWFAPGAILGGALGAWLTHRMPVRWLRRAFNVLLAVAGVRLLWA